MNKLLSASPVMQQQGLALIRIIVGFFLAYHGWEVFDKATMDGYIGWDIFKNQSFGKTLAYLGKGAELVAGILLLIGFLTRIAAIITIGTMIYVAFMIGHGKVWYEDQHPFLFVLLALVFIFTGPGALSVDGALSRSRTK
jgi:putative oxidoreductase